MDNNIEKTINEIKGIAGTVNIKVLSNPYNPNVLKLSRVFEESGAISINDDVVLGAEQAATFENLTDSEEQEIIDYVLAIGGEHEKGRFW